MKVEEFKLSTLAALEKINLDPVFDFSQADEEAKKLIVQTFNDEEQGKEARVHERADDQGRLRAVEEQR